MSASPISSKCPGRRPPAATLPEPSRRMSGRPTTRAARILHARTFGSTPHTLIQTEFSTIPECLRKRAGDTPADPWLIFLSDGGARRSFSYGETQDLALRTAAYLLGAGGVPGDRFAVVAHNHSDTVIQYLACWTVGAVVVPVNVGEDDRRIRYILSDSEARLAFVRREYLGRIKPIQAGVGRRVRGVGA